MRIAVLLLGLMVPLLMSCQQRRTQPGSTDNPVVTVTIQPFSFFANELTSGHFSINTLVPPGANHHSFDPAPRQIREMEESSALFIDGHLGFEKSWVPKLMKNNPDLYLVDLSNGIDLITVEEGEGDHEHEGDDHHHHEGVEPHYWMSPRAAKSLATNMATGIKRADPACSQLIDANLKNLLARIDSLDQEYTLKLAGLKQRSFIIFHPALTYLARDYGLVQIPMELGGKEPTAAHFRNLVDLARKQGINTIFVQREYDRENAETLAREINAEIVIIDPMSGDWMAEMVSLLGKLVQMDE